MVSCQYGRNRATVSFSDSVSGSSSGVRASRTGDRCEGCRGSSRSERRRRNVVASAPDLDLRFAVCGRRFCLVETLECAVVPLVQPPRAVHGNPQEIHFVERHPERADRALEDRRVGNVELEFFRGHQSSGLLGFETAFVAQIDVGPPGESVFTIPGAFSVAKQDEAVHGVSERRLRICRMALRPAYLAFEPSSSSIRSSWLYFAVRSLRLAEPVLI